MRILDKYILKSFLAPFFAAFFIVLFVLVMQFLWFAFDDIAGKGIDIFYILKFLAYTCLQVTPTALPIGVLLSSIMALGNLSEKYEMRRCKVRRNFFEKVYASTNFPYLIHQCHQFFVFKQHLSLCLSKTKKSFVQYEKTKTLFGTY